MHSSIEGVDLHGMKILVAEDTEDLRDLLTILLTMHGAIVLAVEGGDAALARFGEFQPDILVSDLGMPGGDGYSLIRRLRVLSVEDGGAIPAIALSARMDVESSLEAGFDRHLTKPVDPLAIVAAVHELVALRPDSHPK